MKDSTNTLATPGTARDGAFLWMVLSMFAFACMGQFAHALEGRVGWPYVAFVRALVSFAIAVTLARSAKVAIPVFTPRTLWSRSLAGSVGLFCTFYALPRMPVSDALTLTNTTPLWVALIVWLVFGEKLPWSIWLTLALGFAGVILIEQPHLEQRNFAALVALAGGFASALAMISLNRLGGIDPRAVVAHFSAVSGLVMLGVIFVTGIPLGLNGESTLTALALLLGVGLAGTAGQIGLTRAYSQGSAPRVASLHFLQIVFAAVMDMVLWSRSFSPLTLLGIAMICGAAAWQQSHGIRLPRAFRRSQGAAK